MSKRFRVSTPKTRVVKKVVGLALGGLVAFGTIFGAVKLVQWAKQDSTSIYPIYEVGGLNAQGRYEEDKSTLYTKKAFACEGLKATLDFDAEINYEIFYYDILDNFISSTGVLSEGFSDQAPLNGAYARIEITPTNDKDNKISLTERVKYPEQLNLKVAKNADSNVNKKFGVYKGSLFEYTKNFDDVLFVSNYSFNIENGLVASSSERSSATTKILLDVSDYKDIEILDNGVLHTADIFEFDSFNLNDANITKTGIGIPGSDNHIRKLSFKASTKIVLISAWAREDNTASINTAFTLTK